jgi:predicted Rossmann fold nucleotide-binding protein DprA/Smf involved in DNA uptake
VVGSRTVAHCAPLWARLADLAPALVVSGGAAGADRVAAEWARAHGCPLRELRPDYQTHGASAPHVRNSEIVAAANLVLVVWDGRSRGTLSAARHALRLGKPTEWLMAPAPADLAAKPAPRPGAGSDSAQLGLFGTPPA